MDDFVTAKNSLVAVDDLPVGVEAEVVHEAHVADEELGDAPAERGGVEVQDASAGEGARRCAKLLDGGLADDLQVILKRPRWDGYGWKHALPLVPSPRLPRARRGEAPRGGEGAPRRFPPQGRSSGE